MTPPLRCRQAARWRQLQHRIAERAPGLALPRADVERVAEEIRRGEHDSAGLALQIAQTDQALDQLERAGIVVLPGGSVAPAAEAVPGGGPGLRVTFTDDDPEEDE